MKRLNRWTGALLITGLLAAQPAVAKEAAGRPAPRKPKIQLAILLDTSGSMNGLINQARTQLWRIVNQMALTRRKGVIPRLELALFEYGKSTVPASQGHIRRVLSLTTDLDKVSEELFALTTNGGNEYCGQAIRTAVRTLAWSKDPRDFKAIFIAGNEPFTQGRVDWRAACQEAIKRSIVVNTIHCGPRAQGVAGRWEQGALAADGQFLSIDQNQRVARISAPQDKELARLSGELNRTYVAYGSRKDRGRFVRRQKKQDANAERSGEAALAMRAEAKAGKLYDNSHWDLVDAARKNKVDVKKLEEEQLPENMRKMTPAQRSEHLKKLAEQRAELQARIKKLAAERRAHVSKKRQELAQQGARTFDQAVLDAVGKQLQKKGYTQGK